MNEFPANLLERPAVEAATLVALRYLDEAIAAAARLTDRTDAEALHDFRVAVRRLRVTERAYPGVHEGIPKKYRRKLRELARKTNAVRDAEAQIAWFRERATRFTPSQRAALGAVRSRLRARRRRAQTHAHLSLQRRFGKLERKIRRALTTLRSAAGSHEAPFRAIVGATVVQHAMDLRKRLEGATTTSAADVHAARIAAKRLRYLLEPVQRQLVGGAGLIGRLRELQDVLGGLTDGHELQAELRRAGGKAPHAGVTAALKLLEAETKGYRLTIRQDWLRAGPELEASVVAAARLLRPPRALLDRHRPARRRARVPG